MKKTASLFALLFLATTSANALAAATQEEAQRLTTLFQAYLGSDPGVVTVKPDGDSYDATFDFGPLFAKIKEPGLSASLTPIDWTLTPQGGGKWKVDQDQPMSFSLKLDGKLDLKGSIGAIKGTGIYDEALNAFASNATDITQFAFEQTMTDPTGTSRVSYTLATIRSEGTMSGTGDSADGTSKVSFTDLRETISMPQAADGSTPPIDVSITAPSGTQDATIKGLKPRAVNELIAWLVARPSKEAIIADQAALKDKLRAAIPIFGNVAGVGSIDNLSVNTMLGKFGIQKLDVLIDMNGVVEAGSLREKLTFTGFQMPEGLVPPWAANLVPQNFTIDFNVADFNLAAPAALIIDAFDLSKDPPIPKEIEPQLQQALLPNGTVKLGLGPSSIIAKAFDLQAEGSMTAGPVAPPAGQALVKLKGVDEIMAAMQAAPPEMGMQQMTPVVIIAKGMAKAAADGSLSWEIKSTPEGSVTINGTDISKMGGQ
jgi:hypothetical protein